MSIEVRNLTKSFDGKKILTIEEESQKKLFDIVAVEIVKKAPSLVIKSIPSDSLSSRPTG